MAYPQHIAGTVGAFERWDHARHSEAFVELCADPEVMRFLGGAHGRALSLEVSERIADHWESFGFGLWACVDLDGTCVGFSGACRPGPQWDRQFRGEIEIGWRLARAAWGRGFATEGGAHALSAGGKHLGRERMIAFVDPQNERSQAVVRRLGMERLSGGFDRRLGTPVDVFTAAVGAQAAA